MNKKPILKIKFIDFWDQGDKDKNFIWIRLLSKHYQLDFSSKPDLVIFGVFGSKNQFMYRGVPRIFHRSEYYLDVDSKEYDYRFGFCVNDDSNYYMPGRSLDIIQYLISNKYPDDLSQARNKTKHKFCNFVYQNESRDSHIRIKFAKQLMRYKNIDCPSKSLNNMPPFDIGLTSKNNIWIENKIKFQSLYKFSIVFENESCDHCFCNRLADAFCAKSIAIYWGDPKIAEKFNAKAFINCHDYENFDKVIEKIIEIDNDDDLYQQYLNALPFLPDKCPPECLNSEKLETKLVEVVEKLTSKDFTPPQRKINFRLFCYESLVCNLKKLTVSFMPDKLKQYLKKMKRKHTR